MILAPGSAPLSRQTSMKRILNLAAVALVVAASPLGAQLANSTSLPPIPSVRAYEHWGRVERSYDDDEQATTVSLTLPLDNDRQRNAFVRRGAAYKGELSAGFVFPGTTMSSYPEIVTIMLKLTRATDDALRSDREGKGDMEFSIDGQKSFTVAAPLVARSGSDVVNGRPRRVEDTWVVVLTLSQFLRVVNGATVSAELHDVKLEFTGGPLEALRDLASRIDVGP